LRFLRREGGLDVYFNELTGEEVFVGRTAKSSGNVEKTDKAAA
jgi:hypothetical protein